MLDAVRIVAVLGVITVHVIAPHVSKGSPAVVLALRALLATSVPVFIMISGSLNISPRAVCHGTKQFLVQLLNRLLPATVFWTLFYVIVMKWWISPRPLTAGQAVRDLFTASSYAHLYFLPLIIGMTVVTPVLVAYIWDSSERAWWTGITAALWTLLVMALPVISNGLSDDPIRTIDLGTFTYFIPFIGYYVLGRAVWLTPPSRRLTSGIILVAVPVFIGATAWTYASEWTQEPPGQFLLPTYVSAPVMLLAIAVHASAVGLGSTWRIGDRRAAVLRRLGEATLGCSWSIWRS